MSLFRVELPDNTAICPQCEAKYDIHGWHTCGSIDEAIKSAIAACDKEWVADIKGAWNEYVIYPITIDSERSAGCTRVTFDRKPEFPEFLIKWQQLKQELEANHE